MIGAVAGVELLRSARRGRAHVLVWLFAGWLVLQFLFLYGEHVELAHTLRSKSRGLRDAADFARSFVNLVLIQQFILIALVTPAFVAGAITDEKTRGTLQHLLTARLNPTDIVLGKLCARALQVLVLGLVPLPLVAAVGPYAGVPPEFLLVWLAVTGVLIVGLGAVSLLASVWTEQTRNAVLITYCVLGGLWLFTRGPAAVTQYVPTGWREALDPLRPLAPAWDRSNPAEAVRRLGTFAAAVGGLAGACLLVAAWRLRPAYVAQLGPRRPWLGWAPALPRPALERDPVAWKEYHVGRRVPLWLGLTLAALASVGLTAIVLVNVPPAMTAVWREWRDAALVVLGSWVGLLMTVAVGVRASGSICGERAGRAWDVLLATPLTTREIVRGKLHGILKAVGPYVLAYSLASTMTVACFSADDPLLPFTFLMVGGLMSLMMLNDVSLGLLAALILAPLFILSAGTDVVALTLVQFVATVLAMYFLGAVGLYCSARSQSAWLSLLATVAIGYVGGFLLLGVLWTLVGVFGLTNWLIGVTAVYWGITQAFLTATERQVAQRDRMPSDQTHIPDFNLSLPYPRPVHRRPVHRW